MSDIYGNLVTRVDVYEPEEKKPVLYDAKDKPLFRWVGFDAKEEGKRDGQ